MNKGLNFAVIAVGLLATLLAVYMIAATNLAAAQGGNMTNATTAGGGNMTNATTAGGGNMTTAGGNMTNATK